MGMRKFGAPADNIDCGRVVTNMEEPDACSLDKQADEDKEEKDDKKNG